VKRIASFFLASVLGCIALAGAAAQQDATALFKQGNEHYQSGDFQAAERCYRNLIESQPIDSGTVYYNLGNACFKNKKLGEAIYYWEKARRKLPADSDILQNLDYAELMVIDRIDVPEDPLPVRLASRAARLLTTAQESWGILILFALGNIGMGARFLLKSPRAASKMQISAIAFLAIAAVLTASLLWKTAYDRNHPIGVIVEPKIDLRSGPGTDNVAVATVHEGIRVEVRNQANGWYRIALPNGWNGWIPASCLRIL
jgi:tetratricopeptide (TPR) repeat protein